MTGGIADLAWGILTTCVGLLDKNGGRNMGSVRNVRRVAKGKKQTPASDSIETQDARFAESTVQRFVEAIRAGRELPNRDTVHKHFYQAAKIVKKWSDKGAKAWASLQVEELRRTAVAVIAAESNGSAVASSKVTAYRP
jgi:hypothetical protein